MPARKLTDEQIRDIRTRSARGEAHTAIQARYGVNSSFVSNIVVGRTRRAAGGPICEPRQRPDAWKDIPELARATGTADRYRVALGMIATGKVEDPVALAQAALGVMRPATH